ncbi:MAG: hypothetical protein EBT00_10220 [Proteobacteria bacterium]|nr:hypothetical protein [Pseudomonadota bacterium]
MDTRFAGSGTFEGGLQVVAERSELQTREDGFSRRTLWRRAGTGAVVAGAFIAGSPASMAFAAPANQTDATTLRLNAGSEPDTIDPQKASFVGEIDKIMRVFRNLLQFDKTNTLVPDQAAALPVASDGGKTLTFTLKSGLTYSDGKALTAKDYEYGWKRHLDPAVAGDYASLGYIIKGAEAYNSADLKKTSADDLKKLRDAVGVKALNDTTIEFNLTDPAPWFMSVLATWCGLPSREDLVTKGGETWTEPATYVGNGPYILTQWEHQNRMQFKANAKFNTGAPPIETVDYAMINEPAVAFAAYLNNELDATGVQREDKARVDGDPVLSKEFHQFAGSCTYSPLTEAGSSRISLAARVFRHVSSFRPDSRDTSSTNSRNRCTTRNLRRSCLRMLDTRSRRGSRRSSCLTVPTPATRRAWKPWRTAYARFFGSTSCLIPLSPVPTPPC